MNQLTFDDLKKKYNSTNFKKMELTWYEFPI